MLESFLNKVFFQYLSTFCLFWLQYKCFPVKFAKFLTTPILKNICERLLHCVLLDWPLRSICKTAVFLVQFLASYFFRFLPNTFDFFLSNADCFPFLYLLFFTFPPLLDFLDDFLKNKRTFESNIRRTVLIEISLPLDFTWGFGEKHYEIVATEQISPQLKPFSGTALEELFKKTLKIWWFCEYSLLQVYNLTYQWWVIFHLIYWNFICRSLFNVNVHIDDRIGLEGFSSRCLHAQN